MIRIRTHLDVEMDYEALVAAVPIVALVCTTLYLIARGTRVADPFMSQRTSLIPSKE